MNKTKKIIYSKIGSPNQKLFTASILLRKIIQLVIKASSRLINMVVKIIIGAIIILILKVSPILSKKEL